MKKARKKNPNQPIVWLVGVVVVGLIVFGLWAAFTKPAPTLLRGDAWDYALNATDLGSEWSENERNFQTAFDIAQPVNLPGEPTETPSLVQPGLQSSYYVDLSDTTSREAFILTSQVLMFSTVEATQAAFVQEKTTTEWEKVTAPSQTVGDASVLWHLLPIPEAPPEQATYRVDFRYLNAIHSIAVTGRKEPSLNGKLAFTLAQKALAKMQKNVVPEALATLTAAQKPDLRPLVLSQLELKQLDVKLGDRWVYDERLLPSWTPNALLPDPKTLEAFGRVTGYQTMMIKALSPEEAAPDLSAGLFQQVTAYKDLTNAQRILDRMEGLSTGAWATPPKVGDTARGWTAVLKAEGEGFRLVAYTEITFRVGTYIASVRLQSLPLLEAQALAAAETNKQLALKLSETLAQKLRNAK